MYLSIGDQIDQLFSDLNLADLEPSGGKQANTLCMLAMVTIFQYAEKMPDRQAAEALRRRTDWKYALHLSLVYPGLEPSALCEFRQQLLASAAGQEVFQEMLDRLAVDGSLQQPLQEFNGRQICHFGCLHLQPPGLACAGYGPDSGSPGCLPTRAAARDHPTALV